MATNIEYDLGYLGSGKNAYAIIKNSSGQVWAGGNSFVTVTGTALLANAVALTEVAGTGFYAAAFPSGITSADVYKVNIYLQLYNLISITDQWLGGIDFEWNGLARVGTGNATVAYPIQKNTAFSNFTFYMVESSDHITPYTGAGSTVSGQVSLDGAALVNLTNTGSIGSSGSGLFKINLAAADVNGNMVTFIFSATGADPRVISFVTQS